MIFNKVRNLNPMEDTDINLDYGFAGIHVTCIIGLWSPGDKTIEPLLID